MSLRDEVRAKLVNSSGAGWKELVHNQPEVRDILIDLAGDAVAEGKSPKLLRPLDLVLQRKQHINDIDLLLRLGTL